MRNASEMAKQRLEGPKKLPGLKKFRCNAIRRNEVLLYEKNEYFWGELTGTSAKIHSLPVGFGALKLISSQKRRVVANPITDYDPILLIFDCLQKRLAIHIAGESFGCVA